MQPTPDLFTRIARTHLDIPTLTERKSDSLDFHTVSVWGVEAALQEAFKAGRHAAGTADASSPAAHDQARQPTGSLPTLVNPPGSKLLEGKLYLRLLHGRQHPDQALDDWGFAGPVFGPLSAVAMTYLTTIRIYGQNPSDEFWIDSTADMVRWEENYFGDLEIFVAGRNDTA